MNLDEYYGSPIANSDFLMHYGVRGMKWGVRKAIERGDSVRLSKAYHKAERKLAKLSLNANQDLQKKKWQNAKKSMLAGSGASAAISAGLTAAANSHLPLKERLLTAGAAGLAGAAGGLLLNSENASSRRYASDRGHQKAVEKRDEFAREMKNAFKGTKYGSKNVNKIMRQPAGHQKPMHVVNVTGRSLTSGDREAIRSLNVDNRPIKYHGNSNTISDKDRQALDSMKKAVRKGTMLGGGIAAANNVRKYAKQNPKEYARANRAFKKMSFKERMKYSYS